MWSINAYKNAVPGDPKQALKAVLIGLVVYYIINLLPVGFSPEFREQAEILVAMTAGYLIDQAYLWFMRFRLFRKQPSKPNEKS